MDLTEHHFRAGIAQVYGLDVAVFLQDIFYWVRHNQANEKNFFEGKYWTYNAMKAFCAIHPYWSHRQIERIIATCKKEGLILVSRFNQEQRDRTSWYTLTEKGLALFGETAAPDEPKEEVKEEPTDLAGCISPNGEMDFTEPGNAIHQTVKALPDNKQTVNNPPLPPKGNGRRKRKAKAIPDWQPEKFEGFWAAYPRDEDRAKAVEQWDALPQDQELLARHGGEEGRLLNEIALGLKRHLACEDWQKGVGIPYAFRWLRDRKWTEKAKTAPAEFRPQPKPRSYHTEIIDGEEVNVYDE